jgi:putative ABC transport system permease protein
VPFAQRYNSFVTVTARATGGPAVAVRALRDAIRRADPDLAIEGAGTGPTVLGGPTVFLRAMGILALSLGGLTLLLAMVGLYGVQSHLVLHRTREIGVRMSFGATAAQIKRMVLKDGYRPVFEGLAIGLFIGFAGRAIVRAYIALPANARISIVDPWVLATVPIPLVLAAFCACYLPARRAARVDPNVALRHL